MSSVFISIFISITILLIFLLFTLYSRHIEASLLTGFWKADADFCLKSDIDLFLVYIGDNRLGYILVKNSDGLIINSPVEFNFSHFTINPLITNRVYNTTIKWTDGSEYDFFPSKQQVYYYPYDNKLVFMVDDYVYAVLYKDSSLKNDVMPEGLTSNNEIENEPVEIETESDNMED